MTVLITGATGLVGKEIVKLCHEKDMTVHYLSSSKSKISTTKNYKGFYWNIESQEIDAACFKDVSVVIHLAGASISKRWTKAYKKEVLNSRIESTRLLKNTIEANQFPIDHVISASAIGIYPTSQTHFYEETYNEVSDSFLGEVVEQWEAAVDELKTDGRLVSKIRIGLVLSEKGGALPEIVKPVKMGFGAAFGTGEQWQSWIHLKDLAAIFMFVLEQELDGVVNGVAPNPVSNTELTKATAEILKRPLFLPNIPKAVMHILLGEMAMLLFESQRVSSQKLEGEGFQFEFPNIRPTLSDLLL
ncbi:TIGR01777 family oxidoreductase [Winogradskyella aurantiaca]|uniref:TIGR01777 family oxidoreductase n=1 Tax=Winogradskyella aurantiaca TaxID=2219558 RepID=UPI000E1DF17C|nr:TIGR01777 family oxidoreductase [Winogradskyella aurantiaca]